MMVFNCNLIVDLDADTVAVELTGSDTARGNYAMLGGDTTLIKSPNDGEFFGVLPLPYDIPQT